jgi:hypothetical protein
MTRLAIAESYAARHWAVFPCKIGSKEPATRSGVYAGTDDLVTVRRYWHQTDWNIGLWTGGSRLVVIDLDINSDKGRPGITQFLELCAANHFDLESTYCVVTPKSGLHVYFSVDDGFWYPPSVSRIATNIDVRASGSYVVAAGSEVNGIVYEHCCSNEVIPLPDWLAELVDAPPPVQQRQESYRMLDAKATDEAKMKAFRGLARHFQTQAQEGVDRNDHLYWAVRAVGDHIWPSEFQNWAVDELHDIARSLGLSDREIQDTTRSARRRWPV